MPIIRSAKKAHRQSLRRRKVNAARKDKAAGAMKSLKRLVVKGDKKGAQAMMSSVQKALDKAVKGGILNKNTAARRKSGLSKLVKSL